MILRKNNKLQRHICMILYFGLSCDFFLLLLHVITILLNFSISERKYHGKNISKFLTEIFIRWTTYYVTIQLLSLFIKSIRNNGWNLNTYDPYHNFILFCSNKIFIYFIKSSSKSLKNCLKPVFVNKMFYLVKQISNVNACNSIFKHVFHKKRFWCTI